MLTAQYLTTMLATATKQSVFQPAPKKAEKDKTRNIDKMLEQIKR